MNTPDDGRRVMTDARTGAGSGSRRDLGESAGERMDFEERQIAPGFTCMMRPMRKQSNHRLD